MQTYRISTALPRACRPLAVAPARTISTHFPSVFGSDFAPLWRLLDDSLHAQTSALPQRSNAARVFHPRFDVREAANSYELHGELPGIKQEDLDIQFVDSHTLVIKGRTEREFLQGTPAEIENTSTAAAPAEPSSTESAPQPPSPSYSKPTVEDDYVDAGAASSAAPTPTSSSATATEVAAPAADTVARNTTEQEPEYKYWINERSIGEFTRTFQFPGTVDQEAVKASLRNGILRVVVPKLVRGERKIVVE